MHRAAAFIALMVLTTSAHAQYDPMFNESVVSGKIGDTAVRLYLAPSPYIRDAAGNFISSATGTLDVCMYELNLPMILGRLIDAQARGVKVRVTVPPEAKPSEFEKSLSGQYKELEKNKVLRYTHNKSGLMHNKFMVADGASVWMGSYNLTKNDTEFNDNNAIVLSNRMLAANYAAEFEEIWADRHGQKNSTPTPNPSVKMGDVALQNYFSPEDETETAVVREINSATNSIYMMAFGFSDDQMFAALKKKVASGIRVFALFDRELSLQKTSQSKPLKEAKAFVQVSSNNGQMHHKVMVIDESVVITGSPNFSAAGFDNNDENLIIFNCPPLARAFMREFNRCWQAKPYIYSKWTQPVR